MTDCNDPIMAISTDNQYLHIFPDLDAAMEHLLVETLQPDLASPPRSAYDWFDTLGQHVSPGAGGRGVSHASIDVDDLTARVDAAIEAASSRAELNGIFDLLGTDLIPARGPGQTCAEYVSAICQELVGSPRGKGGWLHNLMAH